MGTIRSNGPDIRETDPASSRYTELSRLGAEWVKRGMISDALTFVGRGYLEHDSNAYRFISDNFKVGDIVGLGNRRGVVTQLLEASIDEDDLDSPKVLIGLYVHEFGLYPVNEFDESDGEHPYIDGLEVTNGRTVLYHLNSDYDLKGYVMNIEDFNVVTLCSDNVMISPLVVLKGPTSDLNTWNTIAQAMVRSGAGSTDSNPLKIQELTFNDESIEVESGGSVVLDIEIIPSNAYNDLELGDDSDEGFSFDSETMTLSADPDVTPGPYSLSLTSGFSDNSYHFMVEVT